VAHGRLYTEAQGFTSRVLDGNKILPTESIRFRKDGTPVPVILSGSPILAGDRLQGVIAIYTDISEAKRLERQLRQAQKFEALATLAGGIAHDFNNILMGIQGRISIMLMDARPPHPFHEPLKEIEEHTRSATGLTRQILGFAGSNKVETRPTDLNEVIRKSAAMFGRTREEIRVETRLQDCLPLVEADPGRMEQALLILYVNAWRAMPSGGDLVLETRGIDLDAATAKALSHPPGQIRPNLG